MKKILLDTDIGSDIDDAICLAYLLKEPQCELLGITTVCGESEKIRAYPHEVTLIAIGNLTNIALLLTEYPDTVQLLRGLFIMNGYFGEKALSHPLENWNSWADPLAAVSVFYDDLCRFERGWVQVETECPARLGATDFQADVNGNVEIARSVNKDRFYQRLAGTLGLD